MWEVRFDPLEAYGGGGGGSGADGLPPLLFCTASGELCRTGGGKQRWRPGGGAAGQGGEGLAAEVLLQEACSINSFDADPSKGDLMAVTDFEGLVFAARPQ